MDKPAYQLLNNDLKVPRLTGTPSGNPVTKSSLAIRPGKAQARSYHRPAVTGAGG